MSLDILDQLTTQADQESIPDAFRPHPCGSFSGTITEVKQKTVHEKPVWEIFVKTKEGMANHNRWGFSPQETSLAAQRTAAGEEQREKMIQNIARHKRLFVEVGVWTAEEAKAAKWNDILGAWGKLVGKQCEIVIKPDNKKAGYTTSFLNGPTDKPDINEGVLAAPQKKPSAGNGHAAGYDELKPPGMDSSLDSIPF